MKNITLLALIAVGFTLGGCAHEEQMTTTTSTTTSESATTSTPVYGSRGVNGTGGDASGRAAGGYGTRP